MLQSMTNCVYCLWSECCSARECETSLALLYPTSGALLPSPFNRLEIRKDASGHRHQRAPKGHQGFPHRPQSESGSVEDHGFVRQQLQAPESL